MQLVKNNSLKCFELNFFYRKPNSSFFSIEKVFKNIGLSIGLISEGSIRVNEVYMPHFSKLWKLPFNILYARKRQKEINHITGDIHYAILGFSNRNINVLTIHDCVLLKRFSRFDLRFWIIKWLWYDLPARKADCITVISEQTKKELLQFVPGVSQKVKVVPNFIDPLFMPVHKLFSSDNPILLFVGTTPNKNLNRLCEAIAGMNVTLRIVGALSKAQLEKLNLHSIVFVQFTGLSDAELRELYCSSDMIVFPTLYEGFGLPILEAQATGRPILTSNRPPMNIVSGNGACLVDPYSVSSIREGIENIIFNKEYRDALVLNGYNNVKCYSLEKVSGEYINIYQDLLKKKLSNQ